MAAASSLSLVALVAGRRLDRRRHPATRPADRPAVDRRRISASTRCPAFFLVVVDLGSAAASLYALGYGRHEDAAAAGAAVLSGLPRRHEPGRARRRRLHVPVRLGADVARLLGAGAWRITASAGNARAGFVYLLMATFSGAGAAARLRPAGRRRRRLRLRRDAARASAAGWRRGAGADAGADRRRIEGRPGAAACLAAARASRRAQPRLRADERRDDQGRRLRLHPHRVRPARRAQPGGPAVVGAGAGRRHRGARRAATR